MLSTHPPTYRVIGVRSDGERVLISAHFSREVADKVMRLIQNSFGFCKLRVETDRAPPLAVLSSSATKNPVTRTA